MKEAQKGRFLGDKEDSVKSGNSKMNSGLTKEKGEGRKIIGISSSKSGPTNLRKNTWTGGYRAGPL